ncbi:MAG: hypothetical protein L0Y62_05705, partial [Nitrospirae bacterium]|nr:hypothetical protein [Nitrospirota bacterium]
TKLFEFELESPCDRIIIIDGRNPVEHIVSLLFFDIPAFAQMLTGTHTYLISFNPNYIFASSSKVLVHEIYHLFGCRHEDKRESCYEKIAALKAAYWSDGIKNGFFPSYLYNGTLLKSRKDVNRELKSIALTDKPPSDNGIKTLSFSPMEAAPSDSGSPQQYQRQ